MRSSTPEELRSLVLDYLTHSGYIRSAQTFLSDSSVRHIDLDGNEVLDSKRELEENSELSETTVKQIHLRNQIRYELLCGRVGEAVNIINECFPSLLSMEDGMNKENETTAQSSSKTEYLSPTSVNPAHLLLNVRIQAFVEACRTVPLEYPPKTEGEKSTPSSEGKLTEDPEIIDQQTALLKSAQKLYALANMLPSKKDNERYMKELKNVVGLIAYRVPETSPVAEYLSQERRDALAEQVDRAILCRMGLPVIPRLELLMRENCTIWDFLHELKIPLKSGAHLFPTEYIRPPTASKGEDSPTCPPLSIPNFLNS